MKNNEQCLREMWETTKHNNMHIMGVPEGKERKKRDKSTQRNNG